MVKLSRWMSPVDRISIGFSASQPKGRECKYYGREDNVWQERDAFIEYLDSGLPGIREINWTCS